ncbi:SDR family NAD(P)-dependent oxidoreductase [Listeria seeligeri]|uniref:SDR family NAD(P)-dependent oxidoreductase n=1 Tax=Listeria seeligeri TaxID=1640 RepID=UPI001629FD0C|nr:SDR family NAD(P)-dependent oxidoreductase [Listeria seeligeri]MBC1421739.1 SDR family NAD(P)-dependent oxidoreductase [Listeria seeligeri]MBC1751423.1 SDR family NAD(P)-dependent oxidoreductase [Listeria seeligeri]MBC1829717.1 SDR family NAD(P)-dependent oxidoreductase [Listeria seeligeri]MBC1844141.1 SDR family NAD(P)-dependent oxidoreductase [Listeria seeligeri]MBC2231772.1 SDR family NAD(P)-dependent oxidoreductase [Listeria seeligeri]
MSKKFTVITGASSGIGYETALAFAEKEKNLILIARREEQLIALQKKIQKQYANLDIIIKTSDLSDKEQVYSLYDSLQQYEVETWINNAGVGSSETLVNSDLKQLEQMIDVNISATTILSTLYAKDYAQTQGTQLINVSSAMGYVIALGNVGYSASKFFISVLTEGLAAELKNAPLQAKVLAPALTATAFIQQTNDSNATDLSSNNYPIRTPQEVASYLVALYESNYTVGIVNEKNEFTLRDAIFPIFTM